MIPIMIIVGWASWSLLNKNFSDVPEQTRIYIIIGAVIGSGIISYFLFPEDEEQR